MAVIALLAAGVVRVDCGPLTATVSASCLGAPHSGAALEGAKAGLRALRDLAQSLTILKARTAAVRDVSGVGSVARDMISACELINRDELTPLAAVAGAMADHIADRAVAAGATRVIVDNGGDVAVRIRNDVPVQIGLGCGVGSRRVKHKYIATGDCGICTSGVGGRSLTLGIADAVTVLAPKASIADAAATWIADQCTVERPSIVRVLAEDLYPDTDIPGMLVTAVVGELTESDIREALDRGRQTGIELVEQQAIQGVLLCLRDQEAGAGQFNRLSGIPVTPQVGHEQPVRME